MRKFRSNLVSPLKCGELDLAAQSSTRRRGGLWIAGEERGNGEKLGRAAEIKTYVGLCIRNAYRVEIVVDNKVDAEAITFDCFSQAHFTHRNSYRRFSDLEACLLLNSRT